MDAAERHVLDVVPVGLHVWEATGAIVTLRYANDEAKRQPLPDDDEWRAALYEACLAQEPVKLERPFGDSVRGETWWRAWVTPLGDDSILVAYWDFTAQKQHERSLRASERLNREILSGLQEGVVVVDDDARVVVANEAAAELFGLPLDGDHGPSAQRPRARPARRARAPAGGGSDAARARPARRGGLRHGRALRAPRRLAAVGRGARQPAAPRRRHALRRRRLLRRRDRAGRAGPAHAAGGRHRRADRARQPAGAGAHAGGGAGASGGAGALRRRC